MKRRILIAGCLLAVALAAYGISFWCFKRGHEEQRIHARDPLAWLEHAFDLDASTFAKVKALHESYQNTCGELCQNIAQANARVRRLMESSRTMTPELEEAIRAAQLRHAECRTAMLRHIYETAGLMPPETAARFLNSVTACLMEDGVCIADVMEHHHP